MEANQSASQQKKEAQSDDPEEEDKFTQIKLHLEMAKTRDALYCERGICD